MISPPHTPRLRRRRAALVTLTAAALAASVVSVVSATGAQARPAPRPTTPRASGAPRTGLVSAFGCAKATKIHQMGCQGKILSKRASNGRIAPMVTTAPSGYGPAEIQSAYNLGGLKSGGRTVAIVDAFDDPTAEADLAVYRSQFGLPPCTTANGCFKKVNKYGQASPLPTPDAGWAEEISLDLDMVSATCPDCHILLLEGDAATDVSLMQAVDTAAATPGVVAISQSYGGTEDNTVAGNEVHFNHPGIAITASSGDNGYGVIWPASSPSVTAVGGTSLRKATNARGWTETVWSGAGSGCSAFLPKPAWQTDTGCGTKRTVADVAAVADPATGVAVYDTYNSCGGGLLCDLLLALGLASGADGWVQVGGTSASSPIVSSIYALAGNTATIDTRSYPYSHSSSLFDVTSGSNGSCSPNTYLCTGGTGYDGPTGLGTPNGTGAF